MAFLKTENTRISAIYTCVPQKIERTEDYEWISMQERQLFTKTTGITVATTTTIAAAGVSGTNANLPPYFALAYIMKA